jgi:hypothetical protein
MLMRKKKSIPGLLVLVLILLIVIIQGCVSTGNNDNDGQKKSEEPKQSNNPPVNQGAEDLECPPLNSSLAASPQFERNGDIVNGQIILVGVRGDIIVVLNEYQAWLIENEMESPFENPDEPLTRIDLLTFENEESDLEILLYQLDSGVEVWDIVEQINTLINENGLGNVVAEPNFITGDCPGCSGGIGGDPCPGCSGGIGGDITGNFGTVLDFGRYQFLNQWAFDRNDGYQGDIRLFDQTYAWTAASSSQTVFTGKDIEIAVFDTVPEGLNEGYNRIDWASVPFDLCVWRPGLMIASQPATQHSINPIKINAEEHGLFVTGLAQGVAPEARYILVQALNANAQGDVVSLLYGMNQYANYRRGSDGTLRNTVINLSLGLGFGDEPDRTPLQAGDFFAAIREIYADAGREFDETHLTPPYGSTALSLAFSIYESEGAVIVAAAGNDRVDRPQIPAAFPYVLGVSASTIDLDLSSFSNYGDIGAPGGDGDGYEENPDIAQLCSQSPDGIGECSYAVISIISRNPADLTNGVQNPGFGFWAGSSMSTPMVSGLAALLLDKCGGIPPSDVRTMILGAASPVNIQGLGAGVINVEETMAQECPSIP